MIYLDNAATEGFKPAAVQGAVLAAMRACANPGRSGHRLSIAQSEHVLACRNLLSELFSGYGFERVVFTRSCTEALDLALFGVLKAGDHAVISTLEHNSVLRPLEHLKKTRGVDYDIVPLDENGELNADMVASFVTDRTKLVAITAASNVTGYAPDLKRIRAALPDRVLFVVDGAQGAAALLFSDRMEIEPLRFGGTGSESFDPDMPAFYPDRLEAGTLSYPAICSLFEGALLVKARLKEDGDSMLALTASLCGSLSAMEEYEVFSKPNRSGILSFRHRERASAEIADLLSERFDIAVRGGLHCAPLAHRALGTFPEGLVRASFAPSQSMREGKALLAALKRIG